MFLCVGTWSQFDGRKRWWVPKLSAHPLWSGRKSGSYMVLGEFSSVLGDNGCFRNSDLLQMCASTPQLSIRTLHHTGRAHNQLEPNCSWWSLRSRAASIDVFINFFPFYWSLDKWRHRDWIWEDKDSWDTFLSLPSRRCPGCAGNWSPASWDALTILSTRFW